MNKYLNLGCGSRFHPAWTNVDFNSSSPQVLPYNLLKGIPFNDNFFEAVYHSHLLEHFTKNKALNFMQECFRVLKPGCIIRIVVPDLEQIAKIYVTALEQALKDNKEWRNKYNWIMLELYDQTVREISGGDMLEYLKQDPVPNESFILERIGNEAKYIIQSIRNTIQNKEIRRFNDTFKDLLRKLRERFIKLVVGNSDYTALQIGRFRYKGEIHKWMYDRFSLSLLLMQSGFSNPIVQTAWESQIKDWSTYNLDTNPDGTIYKPDSLYMEATKPLE